MKDHLYIHPSHMLFPYAWATSRQRALQEIGRDANMSLSGSLLSLSLGSLKMQKQCRLKLIQDYAIPIFWAELNICIIRETTAQTGLKSEEQLQVNLSWFLICYCYLLLRYFDLLHLQWLVRTESLSFHWWKTDFKNQSKPTQHETRQNKNAVMFLVLKDSIL